MANEKNLDRTFDETQDEAVYARHGFFRYFKKFKKGLVANGRKQARFHSKTKDLPAGVRRD